MAELTTEQQAAEALAAAVTADGDTSPDGKLNARIAEIQAENTPDAAAESTGATETDSFTAVDFDELPAELQGYAKSLQGDYTRKTQKLAEERKRYEALTEYGGVEVALEAVQFAQNLSSNPEFAMQVQEQLFTALTDAGMSPKAAAAEVQRQVDEAATDTTFEDYGDDDPLVKELKAVKEQLQEVTSWREQQDAEANNRQLAAQIQLQENEILATNPDYVQDDIDGIYQLAYSTGGNLLAAEKVYRELNDRILNGYLARKASVPAGVSGVQGNGVINADVPAEFKGLYDPKLEALVQERLAQEIAAGNL